MHLRPKTLSRVREWKGIHGQKDLPSPCTSLGVIAGSANVVSGGEDGRLNILRLDDQRPYATIGEWEGKGGGRRRGC